MAFQWKQDLSVGFQEIDDQHKELFRKINDLLESIGQGRGIQEVKNMIKFLEDYTATHFSSEEKLMLKHNYNGYPAQKTEHNKFIKVLDELKKKIGTSDVLLSSLLTVQKVTVDWLINHISKMDKTLGSFLAGAVK
jgi:hemerythrin